MYHDIIFQHVPTHKSYPVQSGNRQRSTLSGVWPHSTKSAKPFIHLGPNESTDPYVAELKLLLRMSPDRRRAVPKDRVDNVDIFCFAMFRLRPVICNVNGMPAQFYASEHPHRVSLTSAQVSSGSLCSQWHLIINHCSSSEGGGRG